MDVPCLGCREGLERGRRRFGPVVASVSTLGVDGPQSLSLDCSRASRASDYRRLAILAAECVKGSGVYRFLGELVRQHVWTDRWILERRMWVSVSSGGSESGGSES